MCSSDLAAAFIGKLPAGEARQTLLAALASNWAENDPEAAVKWAQQLPVAEQTRTFEELLPKLANGNPALAATLLEKVTPERRAGVSELIASQWLQSDPAAARAWLDTAPLSEAAKAALKKRLLGN